MQSPRYSLPSLPRRARLGIGFSVLLAALLVVGACVSTGPDDGTERSTVPSGPSAAEQCEACGTITAIHRTPLVAPGIDAGGAAPGAVFRGTRTSEIAEGSGQAIARTRGTRPGVTEDGDWDDTRGALGYRIEVSLDDGREARVVQVDDAGLQPGMRVRIVSDVVIPL